MGICFVRSLLLVLMLIGLLGCAAVEPQRKENTESSPRIKEEDITENKASGQINQAPQDVNPSAYPNASQSTSPLSPRPPEAGGTKTPRRFIWKDKN